MHARAASNIHRRSIRTPFANDGARGMISKQVSTGVYGHFGTSMVRVRVSDRVRLRVSAAALKIEF